MKLSEEKREELRKIIFDLEDLSQALDYVLEGTEFEAEFKSYRRFGMDTLLGNGNPYDRSLFNILEDSEAK